MQVVPPAVKKCVVFIAYKDAELNERLAGTGFFVAYPLGENHHSIYLVTARHVISGVSIKSIDQNVYLRLNTSSSLGVVAVPVSAWSYHEDTTVDAAVLSYAPDQTIFDFMPLSLDMAVTDDVITSHGIGEGDEVFLTGLFAMHYGRQKNLPIIRTGTIALMPDEKIETTSPYGAMDAYLIEARSIGGLSGSPVFTYLGSMRADNNGNTTFGGHPSFLWLGLMHGHWDVDESHIDSDIDNAGEVGKNVNMGIGIVVPAAKILEILEQDDLVAGRTKALEQIKKQNSSANSLDP